MCVYMCVCLCIFWVDVCVRAGAYRLTRLPFPQGLPAFIADSATIVAPVQDTTTQAPDDTTSPQGARAILKPLDPARLSSRMANTALNRVGAVPEGPDLLEPL